MAQKILVCSGKGGVGKSTLTACLAKTLSARDRRVLLLDCDAQTPALDFFTGIGTAVYSWQDVTEGCADFEDALCRDESGRIGLMMPPFKYDTLPTAAQLQRLLSSAEENFDFCLLDAPADIFDLIPILAGAVDTALLVATPDAVSVRAAARLSELLWETYPDVAQRLLINRFDYDRVRRGFSLCADDMVTQVGVQLLGAVPEDAHLTLLSAGGEPSRKTADALAHIAARMLGESAAFQEKKIKSVGI